MEPDAVPRWLLFLSKNPLWRAFARGGQEAGRTQNCNQCGGVVGERVYLLVSTRFLFWAKETTRLCPGCYEQHLEKLRQDGVLPAQNE